MKTLDVKFGPPGRVTLSEETYSELRQFAMTHGETDLPPVPELTPKLSRPEAVIADGKVSLKKD